MYERTTANRSGKITIELHDNFTASGFIDGECIINKFTIFQKITPHMLVKGKWDVEETGKTYTKKHKSGVEWTKNKVVVNVNPLKEFAKVYAVTPSQFCKVFNSAVWKSAIVPYKEFQSLFFGKVIDRGAFISVAHQHNLLTQAVKDGQKNILPIIAYVGETPQELRKSFGKGMWKKLCANTQHRNKLIIRSPLPWDSAASLDSGALKFSNRASAAHWVKNMCKLPYAKMRSLEGQQLVNLFIDTKHMAQMDGQPFNPSWSKLKMQEKHNEYMTIAQREADARRKERDEAYRLRVERLEKADLSKVYPQTTFEKDGVVATILTKYEQIKEEGITMRHCVGTYAENAINGTYAVIHMSGDDEETTLGLSVDSSIWGVKVEEKMFRFNQHYGKCNSEVVSEKHKAMVEVVLQYLNGLKLTKESYEV